MGLNRNLGNLTEVIKENSGLIGIGTASPLNKLDVAGNISLSNGGTNVIRMLQSVAAAAYNGPGFYSQTSIGYGVNANNSHIFIGGTDGNTELMRINGSGNMGLGTASPLDGGSAARWLTLNGNPYSGGIIGSVSGVPKFYSYYDNSSNTAAIQGASGVGVSLWTNNTIRVTIDTNGTALFKRNTSLDPSYSAGFQGAIFFKTDANGNNTVNFFNASTTYVASIVTNASSIVYGTGSDYRLKEDLKDFNGLEKISKIKVYDFKFIKEGDRMDGVLAHELQEVVPYAVTGEKDELDDKGNIKIQNVDYSKLTPILIKAIQELKAEIEILKQNK